MRTIKKIKQGMVGGLTFQWVVRAMSPEKLACKLSLQGQESCNHARVELKRF